MSFHLYLDEVLQVSAGAELCDYPHPVIVLHDIRAGIRRLIVLVQ